MPFLAKGNTLKSSTSTWDRLGSNSSESLRPSSCPWSDLFYFDLQCLGPIDLVHSVWPWFYLYLTIFKKARNHYSFSRSPTFGCIFRECGRRRGKLSYSPNHRQHLKWSSDKKIFSTGYREVDFGALRIQNFLSENYWDNLETSLPSVAPSAPGPAVECSRPFQQSSNEVSKGQLRPESRWSIFDPNRTSSFFNLLCFQLS